MNTVIIDIGLLRYILCKKCKIISIYLIKWFNEQRDYRYWTITIHFEFKIYHYSPKSIIKVFMEPRF